MQNIDAECHVLARRQVSRRYGALMAVDSASFAWRPRRVTCVLIVTHDPSERQLCDRRSDGGS